MDPKLVKELSEKITKRPLDWNEFYGGQYAITLLEAFRPYLDKITEIRALLKCREGCEAEAVNVLCLKYEIARDSLAQLRCNNAN